jgi:transcriptional regulator with XRE-family HTH domain
VLRVPLRRYRWVAERLDVGVTGVRKWFLGQSLPVVDKLLELATVLGVSVQWLLFEEDKFLDLSKLADAQALQVRAISQSGPGT